MKTKINLLIAWTWLATVAGGFSQPAIIQFTSSSYAVNETGSVALVTVELSGDNPDPFVVYSVDYATSNGTATAGVDYVAQSGTLYFDFLETTKTFTVPILDDGLLEGAESVRLILSNPAFDAVLGANSTAVLTIVDDDASAFESWISRDSGTSAWLYGTTYGNGLFVAVGEGGSILTSIDGQGWTRRTNGLLWTLYGVAAGNGGFVAVGGTSGCRGVCCRSVTLSSEDGMTWTPRYVGQDGQQTLFGVTYGLGLFVAVGGVESCCGGQCGAGTVLTSPDGIVWTPRYRNPSLSFYSITFGDGKFVAVGSSILISSNGLNWAEQQTGNGQDLFAAAYGQGTFIAVGGFTEFGVGPGVILSSPNGSTWTERYTNAIHFAGATFGAGTFVAVGYDRRILTSPDGLNWAEHDGGPTGGSFSDATFGNNTFVAVGSDGTILQSAPIATLGIRFDGSPVLTISGPLGLYRMEAATELHQTNAWSVLGTIAVTNSPQVWTGPQATNVAQRFYRVRVN